MLKIYGRPKGGVKSIPKELLNEISQAKVREFFHNLSQFSNIELRTVYCHSLGTAKRGQNHVTVSILDAVFC
jgi:hypothetical protein